MKIIIILLVSIKITYLFKLNPTYTNSTGLIYNGTRYNPKIYPFVVTIKILKEINKDTIKICTGSLVRELFVLTAAHCSVNKHLYLLHVYSGSIEDNFDHRTVTDVYIPNSYNSTSDVSVGDLSVLKIDFPFPHIKTYINIGGHPSEFANLKPVKCVCIGFGSINKNNEVDLRGLIMTTDVRHGKKACQKWKSRYIRDSWQEYLCAVTPAQSMTCKGDTGGPMICNGKLYGVCSFYINYPDAGNTEVECGNPYMQTVHTFLSFHRKWIDNIIGENETEEKKKKKKKKKEKKEKNSGNSLKPRSILQTILAILFSSVLTVIWK